MSLGRWQSAGPLRRTVSLLLLGCLLLEPGLAAAAEGAPAGAAPTGRVKVAVMDFENQTQRPEFDPLSKAIPEVVSTNWAESGRIEMVERSRLQDALREMQLGLAGVVETQSASQLGRAVGANAILVGSYLLFGETIRITARLIDVEKGTVITGKSVDGTAPGGKLGSDVLRQMDELSKQMEAKLTGAPAPQVVEAQAKVTLEAPKPGGAAEPRKAEAAPSEAKQGSIFKNRWFWVGAAGLAVAGGVVAASGGGGDGDGGGGEPRTRVLIHISFP